METHINIENNGITDAEEYFKERLESKNKVSEKACRKSRANLN